MKKRPVLHQLASLCIAASVFFSATTAAQANTLTLPQQFNFPGLTFSTPLTYSHPLPLHTPTNILSFKARTELTLTNAKNTKKKPLEEIVLTPTLSAIQPTEIETEAETPSPTTAPVIDVQAAATEL